ncbi:hypothetical protein [Pseudalkalibacillus berkeleyi]|uniref:Radical SAM protein n=1 Tax=Pseudalkalibacillus berkeleyi TaxID=1069813 RepID=A0ABS9H3J1_9BACL|nr:hypothetical protein [Pseudalkalibacillus berkeleyi]MCF6138220.1 hypothetical protein [Pseudalkalibacillus berkeleyi]
MNYSFHRDDRLGICLPVLNEPWERYSLETQEIILSKWESIRGRIPDRIKEIEQGINTKQLQLNNEENFERSCQLNSDIAELASIINDLWIWYRMDNHLSARSHF